MISHPAAMPDGFALIDEAVGREKF